jgi:penicillin-binding protein 2
MTGAGFDMRLKLMAGLIGAALFALGGRLWMLQITRWADWYTTDGQLRPGYAKMALFNRTQVIRTPAPRGTIHDRNGIVLAETRAVWTACVTPAELPTDPSEREGVIVRLASVFRGQATSAEIREAIEQMQGSVDPLPLGSFAEDVPLEIVAQIEEARSDLPGVSVIERFKRYYPYGKLAAHVLGYARGITEEQYEQVKDLEYPTRPGEATEEAEVARRDPVYARDSEFGQTGIEWALELDRSADPPVPILQGRHGALEYQVDVRNMPLGPPEERPSEPGASVYLALDRDLQKTAEEALHEAVERHRSTGAVVLMDVHTGEVLVMASRPSVDANWWGSGFTSEEYEGRANDPRHPFYNNAIAGEYPPGSVFKIISALAALQTTSVSPQQTYVCNGRIHEGADHRRFKCWVWPAKPGHHRLDFLQAIAQSCDVYFYELVRKAGTTSDAIARYARLFGLGTSTQCGLPGEADGLVPDRKWKLDEKGKGWWTGDTLQFVIGQSFLTVTPLQMTVATAAIANGGKVLKPQLVRKIVWPAYMRRGPTLYTPKIVREADVAEENLQLVRRGMRLAVTHKYGTAHNLADYELPIAGKTGSAQHYPDKQTHAWFVCYAPYHNPRFACAVIVTEGGYGSTTAAPIAAKVMSEALRKYGLVSGAP